MESWENYRRITSASPRLPRHDHRNRRLHGTEVKAGDKLVIIEAMKMLTTDSAQTDGTIKDILVKKGVQVDSDDLLVLMETAG